MARLFYWNRPGNNSPSGAFNAIEDSTVWGKPTRKSIWFKGYFSGEKVNLRYDGNFNFRNAKTLGKSPITGLTNYINNKPTMSLSGVKGVTFNDNDKALLSTSYSKKLKSIIFKGNDKIYGSNKGDTLWGYSGRDVITGLGGHDLLNGGSGNDKIYGNAGDDILIGGQGKDYLYGGKGEDTFHLQKGKGHAIIKDYNDSFDYIYLASGAKGTKIINKNGDAYVYKNSDLIGIVNDASGDLELSGQYLF